MSVKIDEVFQHLDTSLPTEFDYSNAHNSLDFLLRKSLNGKQMHMLVSYMTYLDIFQCTVRFTLLPECYF